MWPTQACAISMMRRLMPPAFISSPARMKNGTASSGKLSMPATRFCASSWVSQKSSAQAMPAPVSTRAKAIGMPRPISSSMPTEKTMKASASLLMMDAPCPYSTSDSCSRSSGRLRINSHSAMTAMATQDSSAGSGSSALE